MLEKGAFEVSEVCELLGRKGLDFKPLLENDIYAQFSVTTGAGATARDHEVFNSFKVVTVYPATRKDIDKFSKEEQELISESREEYLAVTLPYLQAQKNLNWVYNILEKKNEAERIIYEDPDSATGFLLVPDLKWEASRLSELYCLALCQDRTIRSLRDLRACHLPLLKKIRDEGSLAITRRYGIPQKKIRMLFHYQPSFYHLHVHFTHIDGEAKGFQVGRAHLLDDVIDNIETVDPNFYEKKTLYYALSVTEELHMNLTHYKEAQQQQQQQQQQQ